VQSSSLYKLDPFVEHGILRVGGRLVRSMMPHYGKHQILVPQKSLLATVILHDIHRKVGHMLSELRKRYWIPKAGTLNKSILSRCVTCRRDTAVTCKQQIADLSEERLVADRPPFTHTGMDYFGPIGVKRGRSTVKRHGVIFTCFSSRGVHLEMAQSLTTLTRA